MSIWSDFISVFVQGMRMPSWLTFSWRKGRIWRCIPLTSVSLIRMWPYWKSRLRRTKYSVLWCGSLRWRGSLNLFSLSEGLSQWSCLCSSWLVCLVKWVILLSRFFSPRPVPAVLIWPWSITSLSLFRGFLSISCCSQVQHWVALSDTSSFNYDVFLACYR